MITLNKVQGAEPIEYAIVSDKCGHLVFNDDNTDFSVFLTNKRIPEKKFLSTLKECVEALKEKGFPDTYSF